MLTKSNIIVQELPISMRYIVTEAWSRGWDVMMPYQPTSFAFIDRGDKGVISIFSSTPPTTTFTSAHIANDKFATYELLKSKNFPVPLTILINRDSVFNITDSISLFKNSRLVVKPLDGGHGNGITVGLSDYKDINTAIQYAQQFTKSKIIVQQMYEKPIDLRVLVIDKAVVAASIRTPARVYGDGKHTIHELIDNENRTNRGVPYRAKLAYITLERAHEFLGDKIENVPGLDECVEVLGTANYGAGGEVEDCTDMLPEWIRQMSVDVANTMALPVCGVDYLIVKSPSKDSSIEELTPMITEVNKCPSLQIHEAPTFGTPRPVTKAYFDYLATI